MELHTEITIHVLEKPGCSIPMVVYLSALNDYCIIYSVDGIARVYSGSGLSKNWKEEHLEFIAGGGQDTFFFRFNLEDVPVKDIAFDHFVEVLRQTITRPREQVLRGIANLFANGAF